MKNWKIYKKVFNHWNIKWLPAIWVNKSTTPGFHHHSIVLRWLNFWYGIQKIDNADISLVKINNNTPHCKKHGAMNKVDKEGIWRCITSTGYKIVKVGNAIGKEHIESTCKAGCKLN